MPNSDFRTVPPAETLQSQSGNTVNANTAALAAFGAGIYDASAVPSVLITVYGSNTIQRAFKKTLSISVALFLVLILAVDRVVAPFISWLTTTSQEQKSKSIQATRNNKFPADISTSMIEYSNVSVWALFVTTRLYYVCWIYPILAVIFFLNAASYREIADRAFLIVYGKPAVHPQTYDW
ncbi:hypothetical protein HK100_007737 [Physocladia obscura]|uniref:Uncharacterized protein n=1 Tax=Physocladia obscura TaxID=109957 RepID=A0AAD5SQ97_9FUNG|nr:hypothetical protein HK100_007737 [Physocladia obscura]